jgi:hypothetical protein
VAVCEEVWSRELPEIDRHRGTDLHALEHIDVHNLAGLSRRREKEQDSTMIERLDFVQDRHRTTRVWSEVVGLADRMSTSLRSSNVEAALAAANRPGASSGEVQAVLFPIADELGFRDESKGLFKGYQSSALRPDYFRPVGKTGILMEVERGKTTINNMDLLDFWKCHICEHASFLFLLVPRELRQNEHKASRREFASVAKRMESFFRPDNYTNVHGLILIGY